MMMTNLLAMPRVAMTIATGSHEDWIDSIKFMVDDGSGQTDLPQLDIRGIEFEMEVRRSVPDHQVVINASTDDGSLYVGDPPDYGFLIINIDLAEMKIQQPGNYVADIVGREFAGSAPNKVLMAQRVIATIELTIVQGVTR